MTKVSLFFGAGAEASYGLPSGGKFALDIFRRNTSDDKSILKEQLNNIDKQSTYSRWLPEGFDNRNLTDFTKTQYEYIVKGSLENKRNNILDYLNNFDERAGFLVENLLKDGIDIDKIFLEVIGLEVGSYNYRHIIKLNSLLGVNNSPRVIDYQILIDSNWRYIYSPKTDWGKFNKIFIFLYTVKRYIESVAQVNIEKIKEVNGYYHDILYLKEFAEINAIGTTNYNYFIEDITKEEIYYLNGSVSDYYDPYLNKIISIDDNQNKKHIIVPFLFTQSGIKPLTSVKMSKRYVEVFNKFKE